MPPIRFSGRQRAELLALGLDPQAIDQIETEALPMVADRLLNPPPARNDVLDELRGLSAALGKARDAVERLLNADDRVPHLLAAKRAIRGGGVRYQMGGMRLDEASQAMAAGLGEVAAAVDRLRQQGPARHQSADPFPIERIHRAVLRARVHAGEDVGAADIVPSASPTSAFRKMVGICYEAIGAPNADPERAIKAYVAEWRKLQALRSELDAGTERPPAA